MPPPPAAGAGGSYRLDPEALKARIAECDSLLAQLQEAARAARPISVVDVPAHEDASGAVTDQIKKSGEAYAAANRSMQAFLKGEREKLNDALTKYTLAEQQAAEKLKGRHA